MQYVRPDIPTVCMGQAASAAAVLLAAGTPGKRMALPNSRIIIHQPATEGGYGQGSDIEIQAREIMRMRTPAGGDDLPPHRAGRREVRKDIDRDKILTAEEAKEYGLIDNVLASRKKTLVAWRLAELSRRSPSHLQPVAGTDRRCRLVDGVRHPVTSVASGSRRAARTRPTRQRRRQTRSRAPPQARHGRRPAAEAGRP